MSFTLLVRDRLSIGLDFDGVATEDDRECPLCSGVLGRSTDEDGLEDIGVGTLFSSNSDVLSELSLFWYVVSKFLSVDHITHISPAQNVLSEISNGVSLQAHDVVEFIDLLVVSLVCERRGLCSEIW